MIDNRRQQKLPTFSTIRFIQPLHTIDEYRNRAYHPDLGRFLSEDPSGFGAGDSNLFRYCGGDPVNRRDPFGLATQNSDAPGTDFENEGMDSGSGTYTYGGPSDDFMDRVMNEVFGSDSNSGSGSSDAAGQIAGAGPGFGGTGSGSGSGSSGLFGPALGGNGLGILGGGGDVSSGPDSGGNNVATVSGFNLARTYSSGTKGLISLNLSGAVTETIPLFSDGIQDGTGDVLTMASLLSLPRDILALARGLFGLTRSSGLTAVTRFTSAEGVTAITQSGVLRANSYVTLPREVAGLNAAGVERALELQAGRGAFSTSFQVPASLLRIPANGARTSGGGGDVLYQLRGVPGLWHEQCLRPDI